MPPYGGAIAQNVYYADSNLCDSNVDTHIGFPTRDNGEGSNRMKPWPGPFILMVDRGGCTFVQKVRNAQHVGAAGVIIADNTCLCTDAACMGAGFTAGCESAEPIMADDGSGSDISIPSFLMFKVDADAVIAEVKANRPVQLEMKWSLPSPDDRVEYDLWTTPVDYVSHSFLKDFKDVAIALGDRAYFEPHQYIYDGLRANCRGNDGENQCFNLCTNNGRYCSTDPDNDLNSGISGADVVRESLRRICIWKHYGEDNGIGKEWWNYVEKFMELCSTPEYFINPKCVKDAFSHSNVDGQIIERCMKDSGGLDADSPNAFLDKQISSQNEQGIVVLPTAFVNTAVIRGALSVNNIFTAICAGYSEGTTPTICKKCASCYSPGECVSNGGSCKYGSSDSSNTISKHTFTFSLLFIVGLFGGLGAWHYQRTRKEMRDQVRGILAEYMPLEDNEDGTMGNPMDFAKGGKRTSLITS